MNTLIEIEKNFLPEMSNEKSAIDNMSTDERCLKSLIPLVSIWNFCRPTRTQRQIEEHALLTTQRIPVSHTNLTTNNLRTMQSSPLSRMYTPKKNR